MNISVSNHSTVFFEMSVIKWHAGLGLNCWIIEHRWLVHIVPKAVTLCSSDKLRVAVLHTPQVLGIFI